MRPNPISPVNQGRLACSPMILSEEVNSSNCAGATTWGNTEAETLGLGSSLSVRYPGYTGTAESGRRLARALQGS